MFDVKEYIEITRNAPIHCLIITNAYAGLMLKQLSEKQFFAIVEEVTLQRAIEESKGYLLTVLERSTPELIKQAKKSLKGYMEYLIYQDLTSGAIEPEMADKAKVALPHFLKQNKPAENER